MREEDDVVALGGERAGRRVGDRDLRQHSAAAQTKVADFSGAVRHPSAGQCFRAHDALLLVICGNHADLLLGRTSCRYHVNR